jgi:RNA polymerase sigma-70 factor (ECF subfamily)
MERRPLSGCCGEHIVDEMVESTDAGATSQLVEGLRTGRPGSFERFYESYFRRIFSFARRRVGNAAEAEDLTQEVFLAVMRSVDSYRERANFESWVFGVARHVVHQHLRGTERRQVREASVQRAGSPETPEEKLLGRRVVETLDRRLASLEPWQAEAFALQCLERLPRSEVARRTGQSRYAVRTSLERLRRGVALDLGVYRDRDGPTRS